MSSDEDMKKSSPNYPLYVFAVILSNRARSGMEFSGYNSYKIQDFQDTSDFSVISKFAALL